MKKKLDYTDINSIFIGKKVKAKYIETEISGYTGNPLIEALPPVLSDEDIAELLQRLPDFDQNIKEKPKEVRYHSLQNALRVFVPLENHFSLVNRISMAIRGSYVERNPCKPETVSKLRKVKKNFSQYEELDPDEYSSTKHYGFNFAGVSGSGKSQSIQRILSLYPQVINHSEYKDRNLTIQQLVWLKLDCPSDGSIKGLCLNFFAAVDSIFKTTYLKDYGKGTAESMIPFIGTVAANHHLGIWVIDEIQRLSLQRSGGSERMLNFFTQIQNIVGVPMLLVGTIKALNIFAGDFSQGRRGTGQGDLIWDRLENDKQWDFFVENLWDYQYTKKVTPLNRKLLNTLYEETQGIIDLALKTFLFTQERAMDSGFEIITADIIRSVARDSFKILRPALDALRNRDQNALRMYEDLYSSYAVNSLKELNNPEISGDINSFPEVEKLKSSVVENGNSKKKENKFNKSLKEIQILVNAANSDKKISAYENLAKAGYIRSGSEFISREVAAIC
jgi:hypothetical protein